VYFCAASSMSCKPPAAVLFAWRLAPRSLAPLA
jgi:hypothetical protein